MNVKALPAVSVLLLSLATGLVSACSGSSADEECSDYRSDVKSGSAQDTRDISNGNNPCY